MGYWCEADGNGPINSIGSLILVTLEGTESVYVERDGDGGVINFVIVDNSVL